jgi:hypothetical protein
MPWHAEPARRTSPIRVTRSPAPARNSRAAGPRIRVTSGGLPRTRSLPDYETARVRVLADGVGQGIRACLIGLNHRGRVIAVTSYPDDKTESTDHLPHDMSYDYIG